jgi:hypothetical protein
MVIRVKDISGSRKIRHGNGSRGRELALILPKERPRHTSLAREVGNAIPHQLDGDGENQEAEDLVNSSDRIGSQPAHQWASQPEEEHHGKRHCSDADDHAHCTKQRCPRSPRAP